MKNKKSALIAGVLCYILGAEDSYCLFNAAINYKVFKGANLQFAIENIFDRQFYASEATCGRSYNVSLNYNF